LSLWKTSKTTKHSKQLSPLITTPERPCSASRATAIETDLLQIQAEILSDRRYVHKAGGETEQSVPYRVPQRAIAPSQHQRLQNDPSHHVDQNDATDDQCDLLGIPRDDFGGKSRTLTYCVLRLANLD
jgi:hypothetical protein